MFLGVGESVPAETAWKLMGTLFECGVVHGVDFHSWWDGLVDGAGGIGESFLAFWLSLAGLL